MFKVKSFDVNHPNPIFYRKSYTILNGIWDFCFDKNNNGEKLEYFKQFIFWYVIRIGKYASYFSPEFVAVDIHVIIPLRIFFNYDSKKLKNQ